MTDLARLKAELEADPLARGYAAMTDDDAAGDLMAASRTRERPALSGSAVFNAIDPAEFEALAPGVQDRMRDVWGLGGEIDIRQGTNARTILLAAFGAGTATRGALVAAVTETVSRAEELGLGPVRPGDVTEARAS